MRKAAPFSLVDGSEFPLPIPYYHGFEAADWDGDGDSDIFTNEQGKLCVYQNEGSNARPVFRRKPLPYTAGPSKSVTMRPASKSWIGIEMVRPT